MYTELVGEAEVTVVTTAPLPAACKAARTSRYRYLFGIVVLLLVIFASRLVRLSTTELDPDEVWSVWQTFGSLAEIVKWTPYDWTPLYYLIVGFWRALVGIDPFVLRLLSINTFLIALALLYRITRRLFASTAAIIAVAACAALGFAVNISLLLRAYGMLFCFALLAWWLALRYFHQPTVKRGLLLGVCCAITFYLHFTGIFAVAMIGLYTLIVYGRKVWKWWLPGLVCAVLILPEVVSKALAADVRAVDNASIMQQWLAGGATILFEQIRALVVDFAGFNFALWAVLMVVAAFLIFDQYRLNRRVLALALWVIAPAFLFVMGFVGGFTNRHTTWLMAAFAMWIGAGLKFLPRAAIYGVLGMFVLIMFAPVPMDRYKGVDAPLVTTFEALKTQVQSGDLVLIDPNYTAVAPEEWDYFTRAYFPDGLNYVSAPGNARRVWYIYAEGKQDKAVFEQVEQNRIPTAQIGTGSFIVQLYEAPPDVTGVLFSNGMRFHGVDALDSASPIPVWREGQTVRLRLWWSVDAPINADLSEGTYVLDGGDKLAEFDGPPQVIDGPQQTSQWQPNQLYVEERDLTLAYPLPMADYEVQAAIYQSWDGTRFSTPGHDDGLLPILTFHVMSWSSAHTAAPEG